MNIKTIFNQNTICKPSVAKEEEGEFSVPTMERFKELEVIQSGVDGIEKGDILKVSINAGDTMFIDGEEVVTIGVRDLIVSI